MRVSRRVENLPPYLFVEISRKIAEKRAKGTEMSGKISLDDMVNLIKGF